MLLPELVVAFIVPELVGVEPVDPVVVSVLEVVMTVTAIVPPELMDGVTEATDVVDVVASPAATNWISTDRHSPDTSAVPDKTTRSPPSKQNPSTPGTETLPFASTLILTGVSGLSSCSLNRSESAFSSNAMY